MKRFGSFRRAGAESCWKVTGLNIYLLESGEESQCANKGGVDNEGVIVECVEKNLLF